MIKIDQYIPNLEFEFYQKGNFHKTAFKNYLGKWVVLYFYPADFTFVCPTELKEAGAKYQELRDLNCELISISTDSKKTHKEWHDKSPIVQAIDFPMAADPTKKISKAFDVFNDAEGTVNRSTFIIDPKGKLKAFEMHSNSIGRSISEILRKLKALQYIYKHRDELCPASWVQGMETIKPAKE